MTFVEPLVNPGIDHTSPQGRVRRISIALPKLEHRPTRRQRLAFAAVVSGHPVVSPAEWDAYIIGFQGWKYSQRCDRCGGTCRSFDCSGLQCHCLDHFGIGIGCSNSWAMSSLCHDEGLLLPLDIARGTQSIWAVKGANLGRAPEPGTTNGGHIVDGRGVVNGRAETMEAMGTKWGCLIGSWDGRGWDAAYYIPGVDYVPPAPALEENDMQVFFPSNKPNHPDAHTQFVPAGNALFPLGALISRDGASIANDQKTNDPNVRLLVPKGPHGWVACNEQRDGRGLRVLDTQGNPSKRDAFLWT